MSKKPMGGHHGRARMQVEKPKDAVKILKKLLKYLGKNNLLIVGSTITMILSTLLMLALLLFEGNAIDSLSYNGETLGVNYEMLYENLIYMAVAVVLYAVLKYMCFVFSAKISRNLVKALRGDLLKKIGKLSVKYIDDHKNGDLMSRTTNDVESIASVLSNAIVAIINGTIMITGCLVIMLSKSVILTIVALVPMLVSMGIVMFMTSYMRKYFKKQQESLGKLNSNIEETISNYKTVKAYRKEDLYVGKFDETCLELKKNSIKSGVLGNLLPPIAGFVDNIGFLFVAVTAGYMCLKGSISVGTIQIFILCTRQLSNPINEAANLFATIQTALAGSERIFEVLEENDEINEGNITLEKSKVKGDIEFKDVKFGYNSKESVINGFNLKVKAGEKIAIVGATGSGKTTLVNLLMRFYEINKGEILIDGINIKDVEKSSLRERIGIVLQDTTLFAGSIEDNIRYGNLDATDSEVIEASKKSGAHDFVMKTKEGYKTNLASNTDSISAGEKQLLSIARVILNDPDILVLDEATSNVDTRTEMKISEGMIKIMENRTSLIIAHRLSTIRDADRIIVISKGQICEIGNHDELMKSEGEYYKLYNSQFAGLAI